ncbi:MAG: hypothetical protein IJ224_06225 [Lachnospiraceae bacterium]|nr:hypothetical protein [Lachnospiraceae bacterium]
MKKKIALLISLVMIMMSLSACGKAADSGSRGGGTKGVNDVLEEGVVKEEEKNSETTQEEATTEKETEATTEAATEATTEVTTEEETTEVADTSENAPKEATVVPPEIDVDLTKLSSTMVYSEVYNMMVDPDSYLGKTIKMSGAFAVYTDQESGKNYFACIIQDATACCAQGIEFTLDGNYNYPADYPAVDDEITVTGTFSTYEEDGYIYSTLLNAKME